MTVWKKLIYACVLNSFFVSGATGQTGESYVVANVKPDDVLNVRTGPGAKFSDIGDVPHDGQLQVIGFNEDKSWAEVIWQDDVAWVSANFLKKAIVWPELASEALSCGGTEPFWDAEIKQNEISFAMMGQASKIEDINWTGPAQGRPEDFIKGITAGPYTLVVRKQICSDGMSDQEYPWAVVVMNRIEGGVQMVEGCCR